MTDQPLFFRLAVLGCGMIGASVMRAARQSGAVSEIVGYDADAGHRARVAELGIADRVAETAEAAVSGADLVILATPVLAMAEVAKAAAGALRPGATVSDVGSVKGQVAQALDEVLPRHVFLIPGHPIAGAEKSGPDAGSGELFHNRWTILTPQAREDQPYLDAVKRLADFWTALGANVETMDAEHHDLVLAVTSHLPHLIAYNIVGTAADMEAVTRSEVIKYSAGGFRDFTRIAASDPTMWRDVFLTNKEAVLEVLGRFTEDLQALSRAIRWGEGDKLHELFTRTRDIRRGVVDAGQDISAPNFGRGQH
ncbi:MAG: prephenate/arogenate dehydrogenase family protein [Caulobacteraceae bacterium]|nr:prephenate/arogenate dehydrogenase family protein [Caulobacteraceae bacterium]